MLNYKEKILNKQINDRFKVLEEIDKNTSQIETYFNYNKVIDKKIVHEIKPQKIHLHHINKCNKKHSRNVSINYKTTRTSTSISQKKKSSSFNFQEENKLDSIGVNLYKRGLEFNAKKDLKNKDKRANFYQGFTFKPKISIYSQEIKERNPYKFEERLYNQSSKIISLSKEKNNSFVDQEKSLNGKFFNNIDTSSQIYPQKPKQLDPNPYNFTPRLNKKSLKIAKTLGSSLERLTKNISSQTKQEKSEEKSIISKRRASNKNSYEKETLCHSLYERGLNSLSKKKQKMSEREKSLENTYLSFSFKPQLNYTSEIRESLQCNKRSFSNLKFFDRIETFDNKKKNNLNNLTRIAQIEHSKTFTFKPKITQSILKDEENELFKRSNKQIIDYTNKLKKYRDLKNSRRILPLKYLYNTIKKSPSISIKTNKSSEKSISPTKSIISRRNLFKTQSFFNNFNLNESNEYYYDDFSEIDQQMLGNALEKLKNLI